MQHLLAAALVQHGDVLQRRQRHLLGAGVGEPHVAQAHAHRAVGQRPGVRALGDHRLEVEHLEHPLERHQRRHHVDAGVRQRGHRRVEPGEQQRERDDRPRRDRPGDRQVPAQAVDQRLRQRRDQRQRGDEHPRHHRRPHADVADPLGPLAELARLLVRPAEQLHQGGARRGEPLRHLAAHAGVEVGRLAAQLGDPSRPSVARAARRSAAARARAA